MGISSFGHSFYICISIYLRRIINIFHFIMCLSQFAKLNEQNGIHVIQYISYEAGNNIEMMF